MHRHLAAWLATGPAGHLYGGVADWAELLARHLWSRARARVGLRPRAGRGDMR